MSGEMLRVKKLSEFAVLPSRGSKYAAVVDYDYRGNVGVVLFNHAEQDFAISRGDRIAQLILERICMADMEEVEELPDTERGAGGFGSTGVAAADESATKKPRLEAEESK
eukprot:gene530-358_t